MRRYNRYCNHTWGNWVETTAPTTTTEGEETRTCTICGATGTQPIAKLPPCPCPEGTEPPYGTECPAGCVGVGNDGCTYAIALQRDFPVTLLGKTVTVRDARTGADDQPLEELGVIEKFNGAITLINGNVNIDTAAYNRVLDNGLIIIVEKPTNSYNGFKTKDDGKTILFDIDYIINAETAINRIASLLSNGVINYLDKGIEEIFELANAIVPRGFGRRVVPVTRIA